jgi:hypothetical protein
VIKAELDRAAADEVKTEKQRWRTVLASPHYAGRERLAQSMLETTDTPADGIIEMLKLAAVAPKQGAQQAQRPTDTDEYTRGRAEALRAFGLPADAAPVDPALVSFGEGPNTLKINVRQYEEGERMALSLLGGSKPPAAPARQVQLSYRDSPRCAARGRLRSPSIRR